MSIDTPASYPKLMLSTPDVAILWFKIIIQLLYFHCLGNHFYDTPCRPQSSQRCFSISCASPLLLYFHSRCRRHLTCTSLCSSHQSWTSVQYLQNTAIRRIVINPILCIIFCWGIRQAQLARRSFTVKNCLDPVARDAIAPDSGVPCEA